MMFLSDIGLDISHLYLFSLPEQLCLVQGMNMFLVTLSVYLIVKISLYINQAFGPDGANTAIRVMLVCNILIHDLNLVTPIQYIASLS